MIIDHLELSTGQFDEMCAFYDAVLAPLEVIRIVAGSPAGYGRGERLPFWIRLGDPITRNAHYAFACLTRTQVHHAFDAARALGAAGLREPKLHPHIDPNYYAAYAYDPDGHLIEFVCRSEAER